MMRPCRDCGVSVYRESTGTFRAPWYVPCTVTGDVSHRVEP